MRLDLSLRRLSTDCSLQGSAPDQEPRHDRLCRSVSWSDVQDVARSSNGYAFSLSSTFTSFSGDDVGGAIPDPISNSEVKPSRADGTARARAWESRSLPGLSLKPSSRNASGAFSIPSSLFAHPRPSPGNSIARLAAVDMGSAAAGGPSPCSLRCARRGIPQRRTPFRKAEMARGRAMRVRSCIAGTRHPPSHSSVRCLGLTLFSRRALTGSDHAPACFVGFLHGTSLRSSSRDFASLVVDLSA